MLKLFRAVAVSALMVATSGIGPVAQAQGTPNFGDDTSRWAKDGECDDKRFSGAGMTGVLLLDKDIMHDAADCREAWRVGDIWLATAKAGGSRKAGITPVFGDDKSMWARDDECDDPRFAGRGMTETTLLEGDAMHDATDCRAAWMRGELRLANISAARGLPDFGDDDGGWAEDGECDDKRFIGPGMTDTALLDSDVLHDATDCSEGWLRGDLTLARGWDSVDASLPDFGDDEGDWAEDGECDDRRFEGPGMTTTPLLDEDVRRDATDCRDAWFRGDLHLR